MKNDNEIIKQIRQFNRFYTNIIGVVDKHILNSEYTLTEGRILYEIYFTKDCSAKKIKSHLNIDWGHLSRIISSFVKKSLVTKMTSSEDKRITILKLTNKGEQDFLKLNQSSENEIGDIISKLSNEKKNELVALMTSIQTILSK